MASSIGENLVFPEENPIWNSVVKEAEEYNKGLSNSGEDRHSTYSLNESEDGDAISDLETLSAHSTNKLSSPKMDYRNRGFSIGLKPLRDNTESSDHDEADISRDTKSRSSPIYEEKPYSRSVQIPTNPKTVRKDESKIDKAKDMTKPRNQSHTVRSIPRSTRGDTKQPLKQDTAPERNSRTSVAKNLIRSKPISPNSEMDAVRKDADQPQQKKESTSTLVSGRKSNDVVIQPKKRTTTPMRGASPTVNQGMPNQTNRRIPLRMRGTSPATVKPDERSSTSVQINKTPLHSNNDRNSVKKISSTAVVRNSPARSSTSSEPTTVQAPPRNQRNMEKQSTNSPTVENRPSPLPGGRPLRTVQSRVPPRSSLQSKKITPTPATNEKKETNVSNINNISSNKNSTTAPINRNIRPSYGRQSPVVKSIDNEPIPSQRNKNNSNQSQPPNPLRNAIPPRRNIPSQSSAVNSNSTNPQYRRNQRSESSTKTLPVRASPMNQISPSTNYNHATTPSSRNPNVDQKDRSYEPNILKSNAINEGHQNSSPQSRYPPSRSLPTQHPVNENPINPIRHSSSQNPANSRISDRNSNAPPKSFNKPSGFPSRPGPGYPVNVNNNSGPTPPARRLPAGNTAHFNPG